LKWGAEKRVPLARVLAKITAEPARILGVEAGCLSLGATADLCIFDPEQYWKVEAAALKSQGKNTPFLGMELPGRVKYTLINGNIVHEG
jgi:dihydroorotase